MENKEIFHTLPEVAEMLKVSRQSVYRWIRARVLTAYKVGHDWRIKDSDLQEFLEARKAQPGKGEKK